MATSKKNFMSYIAPMWKAFDEMTTRVPMTDWYDTVSGQKVGYLQGDRMVGFQHRSVQGGLWMRVLMDKWSDKK
jgi:hypothetical protein